MHACLQAVGIHNSNVFNLFCCSESICCLCSVGIKPPGIEVRFQDIFIETSVYTNVSRNLPSILNAYRGFFEVRLL